MPPLPLAENDYLKLIGGVVFILFWAISAIAGNIAKKKEQEELRRRNEEYARNPQPLEDSSPVLPPSLPDRPRVTTRDELERRIAEARSRRQSSNPSSGPLPRDIQSTRTGDPSSGPQPRDLQSARSGSPRPDFDPSMSSRPDNQDFRNLPSQDSFDDDSILASRQRQEQQRLEAERLHRELEATRQRSEQLRITRERQAEKQRRQKTATRPPILAPQTVPSISPPHLHDPNDSTVHRTVATEPLQFSTASLSANQRPQIADAATISRWLTPAKLRQQYILTELLSPPMALRPEREF